MLKFVLLPLVVVFSCLFSSPISFSFIIILLFSNSHTHWYFTAHPPSFSLHCPFFGWWFTSLWKYCTVVFACYDPRLFYVCWAHVQVNDMLPNAVVADLYFQQKLYLTMFVWDRSTRVITSSKCYITDSWFVHGYYMGMPSVILGRRRSLGCIALCNWHN